MLGTLKSFYQRFDVRGFMKIKFHFYGDSCNYKLAREENF